MFGLDYTNQNQPSEAEEDLPTPRKFIVVGRKLGGLNKIEVKLGSRRGK